jgi:hypothetical protein
MMGEHDEKRCPCGTSWWNPIRRDWWLGADDVTGHPVLTSFCPGRGAWRGWRVRPLGAAA